MNGSLAEDATTLGFSYAIKNEKKIRAMLLKVARGDATLADDMFSDVAVARLPRLFELYDGVRPVDNYMMNNIRWYAFKYTNAKHRKMHPLEVDIHYQQKHEFVDCLEKLDELDRYLIEANVIYGIPFTEMAVDLRWPVNKVSKAVKAAKAKVAAMYEENSDWLFVKKVLEIIVR